MTFSRVKSACARRLSPSLTSPQKTTNMKQSKKGACSSNTQTAKANCLAHNRRNQSTEKVPGYVNKNRSHLNRTIFEDEIIKGKKSIVPLVHAAEKLYTEKTGQKCQKSFAPFREACLHLKEGITDAQLLDFKAKVEKETKWKVIGIWLHEDEGHVNSKYIEGNEDFSVNHHAHVLFSCQDLNTGKAIRADRTKLSHMQDLLAEATGMERGYKAAETGRTHRSAMEQRLFSQEQRIEELETKASQQWQSVNNADAMLKQIQQQNEEEEEERKRIKAKQEADLKAYNTKKAVKEAAKSASEGIKGFFGQSSKDKQIKALQSEINALRGEKEALIAKVRDIPKAVNAAVKERLIAESQREINNYRTLYTAATGKRYLIGNEGTEPKEVINAIRDLNLKYKKECELATNWCKYAKELEEKEERRWGRGLRY